MISTNSNNLISYLIERNIFNIASENHEFYHQISEALNEVIKYPLAQEFLSTLGKRLLEMNKSLDIKSYEEKFGGWAVINKQGNYEIYLNLKMIPFDFSLFEDERKSWCLNSLPLHRYLNHELIHIFHYTVTPSPKLSYDSIRWTNQEERETIEGNNPGDYCENTFAQERGEVKRISHSGPEMNPILRMTEPSLYHALMWGADGNISKCDPSLNADFVTEAYLKLPSNLSEWVNEDDDQFWSEMIIHKMKALSIYFERCPEKKKEMILKKIEDSANAQIANITKQFEKERLKFYCDSINKLMMHAQKI